MRILVISNSPWDDRNSFGNTISNWFGEWKDAEFFCVYCRSSMPNNEICHKHYTVPPLSLLMNMFRPSKTGWAIDSSIKQTSSGENTEANLIKSAQHGNNEWMYLISDLSYSTGVWRSKAYKKFIAEANPDIVFSFGIAESFIYENYRYVKKHTNAKIVTFVADDVYGAYLDGKGFRSKLQAMRFRKMMQMSDYLYGASELMCNAYQGLFGKPMKPLYKGCSFSPVMTTTNHPLRIVYAGNLLWGRSDILGKLAQELENVNKNGTKATLEIYTGSFITPEMELNLNRGQSSRIIGRRSYDDIVRVMNEADIVLHVESFAPESIKTVRYSFSTKIVDCLQSGSAMMIIGPAGIASVEYPKLIPGAIVVDGITKIGSALKSIISDPSALISCAQRINGFAKQHHSINSVRLSIHKDFLNILIHKD